MNNFEKGSLDPAINILHKEHFNLDFFFNPKTVALVGASEKKDSVGRTIFENLINSSFKGDVFPINPNADTILGYKSYKSIKEVPKDIELVIIAIKAKYVIDIVKESANINIPAAIIISAGFKELGEKGVKLEEEILNNKKKMRIIGPNCLGIMNPHIGLNATFACNMPKDGPLAFISQSGALGTAVLDWSLREKIGFSTFVSVGSMIDVNWGDLINYLGNDPKTKSILIYMESISDPKAFLSAAREVALTKPIILIKAGKTEESANAAKSHTGALTGSDEVLDAAFQRVGILRVDTIEDLFSMAEILSKQSFFKGPNLAIITNAGGPGVIATDALLQNLGKLAKLEDKTYKALNEVLPSSWSHSNPIDILGDATSDIYYRAIEIVSKDANVDGLLIILTPQFMTNPTQVAEKIKEFQKLEKPIFVSFMGGDLVEKGIEILTNANVAVFKYPDLACRSFGYMCLYDHNLKEIYESPKSYLETENLKDILEKDKIISNILSNARSENRVILDEVESKNILQAFDIPIVETKIAKNEMQAISFADGMGYPIVLKVFSKEITHKSDIGGVKLNLQNATEVSKAFNEIKQALKKVNKEHLFEGVSVQSMIKPEGFELIIGSYFDDQFGSVILFGHGGILTEVLNDKSISLPPINMNLAIRLIEKTKIYKALKGFRNIPSIDIKKLAKILVNFSNLIIRYPQIKECDINPIIASKNKIIALDARIILHPKMKNYPKPVIRPYPINFIFKWKAKNAQDVIFRPITSEDESYVRDFYKEVSEKSLKQRYFKDLPIDDLIAHENLIRICYVDYDRELTLVCESDKTDTKEILAIARLTKSLDFKDATFSILVKDTKQNMGLGKELLKTLIKIATDEKVEYLKSKMFEDNIIMKEICKKLGFELEKLKNEPFIIAKKKLF